ncbi:hypothetical protein [Streptomyces sp. TE5632]
MGPRAGRCRSRSSNCRQATATRDDTRPAPYGWTCTCGASHRFLETYGLDRSAWRHTHPTLLDQLRQWAARLLRTRSAS